MSLNGLDTPEVQEAYTTAVAEAGGWVLLKYATRDRVELLSKGSLGVSEARSAISAYDEASPLYGLLIYRRRKVLIKYIPADTSRLLKARTAVHFQDVIERFSPYETILEIATAEALNDTSLAASFPLHTASPAPGATSRLQEISEDAEDAGSGPRPPPKSTSSPLSSFSAYRAKAERRAESQLRASERVTDRPAPAIKLNGDLPLPPAPPLRERSPQRPPPTSNLPPITTAKPSISQFLVRDESGQTSITSLEKSISLASDSPISPISNPSPPTSQTSPPQRGAFPSPPTRIRPETGRESPLPDLPVTAAAAAALRTPPPKSPLMGTMSVTPSERDLPDVPQDNDSRRPSATSTTDATSPKPAYDEEPYDFSKFDELFKPKVKLGPRPVADVEKTRRPNVATVSGLPANLRKKQEQQQTLSSPITPRSPVGLYPEPQQASIISPLSPTSLYSASQNLPIPPPIPTMPEYNPRPISRGSIKSVPTQKSAVMSADKLRLMKAMELRKKQMRKSNTKSVPAEQDPPAVPTAPTPEVSDRSPARSPIRETAREEVEQALASKADSGIDYEKDAPGNASQVVESAREAEMERARTDSASVEPAPAAKDADSAPAEPAPAAKEEVAPVAPLVEEASAPEIEQTETAVTANASQPEPIVSSEAEAESMEVPVIMMADGSKARLSDRRSTHSGTTDAGSVSTARALSTTQTGSSSATTTAPKQTLASRRRGFVEPLQNINQSGNPDDFGSDDEGFLDELQSATVQEAMPIAVAKSPTNSAFDRRPSATSLSAMSEGGLSVKSITIHKVGSSERMAETRELLSPEPPAKPQTYIPTGSSPSPGLTPVSSNLNIERNEGIAQLSRNVSSGISRRFMALAEKSNRESTYSGSQSQPVSPDATVTTFLQQHEQRERERKAAFRSTGSRSSSIRRGLHRASFHPPSPGIDADNAPVLSFQHDPLTNRNSVSVTARIIRPTAPEPVQTNNEPQLDPDLHLSQDYEPPPFVTPDEFPTSASSTSMPSYLRDRGESIVSNASTSYNNNTNNTASGGDLRHTQSTSRFARLRQPPNSGIRTPSAEDFPPPPSTGMSNISATASFTPAAPSAGDENASLSRESSRASRFFKRMSVLGGNSTGGKRRGSKQSSSESVFESSSGAAGMTSRIFQRVAGGGGDRASSIAESRHNTITSASAAELSDMPPAVVVGDLNVQFPEALLWKRRIVNVDDMGYLQFSIAQSMDINRAVAVRKHHLSEFRAPSLPDADQQELPHSVFLEFGDRAPAELKGTTIQAACEDAMTHRAVLHLLKTYHKAWTAGA